MCIHQATGIFSVGWTLPGNHSIFLAQPLGFYWQTACQRVRSLDAVRWRSSMTDTAGIHICISAIGRIQSLIAIKKTSCPICLSNWWICCRRPWNKVGFFKPFSSSVVTRGILEGFCKAGLVCCHPWQFFVDNGLHHLSSLCFCHYWKCHGW